MHTYTVCNSHCSGRQAHFSTGVVAAGFTSTVMEPVLEHEAAVVDDDTVRYKHVKKKGQWQQVMSV